ncbi:MAG TPA: hypothetical protein VN520_12320 [Streptomyces sp.]|uniref:hypothetical protein n=1 Tax=Streptomyces sp. TaxID=1931 RepID=UPI002BA52D18|nr:hypothetical protein [Streptomyces sp.]HWU07146.1 hypothetical protein [Streptomyces sp.]
MASLSPIPHPGDQLASATDSTRVIVIRAPRQPAGPIECGGAPMIAATEAPVPQPADGEAGTLIGKRYVDAAESLELLCTASGSGRLAYAGEPLTIKAPKALPASD